MVSLTNAYWVRAGNKLGIRCKLDDGSWKTLEPSIRPYFFIRLKDLPDFYDLVKTYDIESGNFVNLEGEKCLKILTDFPDEVRTLRERIGKRNCYEADVPFARRWMIDLDIKCSTNPKLLFVDMEVDSREGFPLPESPDQRILCIGAVDSNEKEYYITSTDELEIIKEFERLLDKFDIAIGWNVLRWDLPYLEARSDRIGHRFYSRKVRWLDAMILYNKLMGGGHTSLKLDAVGEKVAGLKKLGNLYEFGTAERLWKLFSGDLNGLKEYVVRDALIVKRISDKTGLIENSVETASFSNLFYDEIIHVSRVIDALILKKSLARKSRIVFPNKFGMAYKYGAYARGEEKKSQPESFKGGLVIDPKPGLYFNVLNYDFKALYPSIIRTFNIGIDTIWKDEGEFIQTEKLKFKKSPRSIFCEFLDELEKMRDEYKKLRDEQEEGSELYERYQARQYELKVLMNVTYGVIGAYGFRFYNKDVTESITLTGQWLLRNMIDIIESYEVRTIAADTDGGFFTFSGDPPLEKVMKKVKPFEELVNYELKRRVIERFGVPEDRYILKIKLDNIYTKLFFGTEKKRYVGEVLAGLKEAVLDDYAVQDVMIHRGKKVVGYELKRGDSPGILRKVQDKIFDTIFQEVAMDRIEKKVKSFLRNMKRLLYAGDLDEELVIEKGTRRKLELYKSRDVHVKVAEKLVKEGIFRPGDSVSFVVTGTGKNGMKGEPVIKGREFPKIDKSGYDYYFYRRILSCVERIFGRKLAVENETLEKYF